MMLGRWSNFTPLELIVISEALNHAFEEHKGGVSRWDEEAQKLADGIPTPADLEAADEIICYLNGDG